jgi:hypothetical protein
MIAKNALQDKDLEPCVLSLRTVLFDSETCDGEDLLSEEKKKTGVLEIFMIENVFLLCNGNPNPLIFIEEDKTHLFFL